MNLWQKLKRWWQETPDMPPFPAMEWDEVEGLADELIRSAEEADKKKQAKPPASQDEDSGG